MNLHKVMSILQPFKKHDDVKAIDIVSIENDNRKVQAGSLFICIKGYTVDGHDFASSAVEKGAVAIVAEKELPLDVPVIVVNDTKRAMAVLADAFYEEPTKKIRLIGVTGTNGKTTTSHLIDEMLKASGEKTGLIGTMYTKVGEEIQETKNTTPESLALQKIFHKMVQSNVDTAIMEVSSHALDEGRVHGCDYDIAVFTNLTQDHLDYHVTMDEYKRAKGLLFSQLGGAFHHDHPKYSILNTDDLASEQYAKSTTAHLLTYGIDHEADVRAKHIRITAKGTAFTLLTPFGEQSIEMKLVGKFSVYNVLAAIATGIACKLPFATIIETMEKIEGVAGRFEAVVAGQEFSVIVDYSHTPDSLENALKTVQEFATGRIFTVVGCGGDRDRTKRPLMAQIACEHSSDPIFTSDNPRSEDPKAILGDMEAGVAGKQYITIVDRKEAIEYAIEHASKGDVILIAGKGHETYQQVGSEVFDFDDRLVAKEAIVRKINEC